MIYPRQHIAILTVFHPKRHGITRLFAQNYAYLREFFKGTVELSCYAGINVTQEGYEVLEGIAQEFSIEPCRLVCSEQTLGRKWNLAAQYMIELAKSREERIDYVLILGDDDILSTQFIKDALPWIMTYQTPYIGIDRLFFLDSDRWSMFAYAYPQVPQYARVIGAGRLIRYDIFQLAGWRIQIKLLAHLKEGSRGSFQYVREPLAKFLISQGNAEDGGGRFMLWLDELSRGLDASADANIAQVAEPMILLNKESKFYLVDVKSAHNIWSFASLREKIAKSAQGPLIKGMEVHYALMQNIGHDQAKKISDFALG